MRATKNTSTDLIFKEFNIGKSKTVRHYEISKGNILETPLTETLHLSNDRGFAKIKTEYWLSIRGLKKWIKPAFTGLFLTSFENLFIGDQKKNGKKESLLLFDLTTPHTLRIRFYKGYYPDHVTIKKLLKQF